MSRRPALAVIGSGRLARTLVPLLAAKGWSDIRIVSRRPARATASAADALPGAGIVLLAVPDGALAATAKALLRDAPAGWRGRVVLHAAGALGTEPLEPLRRAGAAAGVLHPLQVLGLPEVAGTIVRGSGARIEGDRRAVRAARGLARDLGLVPLPVRPGRDGSGRAAYHAAASLASNDVVALIAEAVELLQTAGVPRRRAVDALVRLARGALVQMEARGVRAALTGPVARGDVSTVGRQLRALRSRRPAALPIHRAISRALADLALREGVLDVRGRRAVLAALGAGGRGRKPDV